MGRKKADLIIHPIRLRILQILSRRKALSTSEIAKELPAVPKSSLYRHLQKLLEGGMVTVEKTVQVRGVHEKYYSLLEAPYLSMEDVEAFDQEDHIRTFTAFTATLIQDFNSYIRSDSDMNLLEDRTGYSVFEIYVNNNELDEFGKAFSKLVQGLMENKPKKGRRLQKLAFITHPVGREGDSDG